MKKQNHGLLHFLIGVLSLLFFTLNSFAQVPLVYDVENTGAACTAPPLPTISQLTSYAMLPDPFKWANKTGRISTFADWECRRNEIKAQIENYEIGVKPPKPSNITATYSGGTLTVKVTENGNTLTLTSKIVLPSGAGPFPAIIGMNSGTGSLPASVFSSRNIAQITYNHDQVTVYNNKSANDPFFKLYPNLTANGQYSAWAWGVSRIIDGLELVKAQLPIDTKHIAVSGCSYAGKMALFAGAFDERIALTIPEESGGGGCASWRFSETMGSVEKLGATNHQWFKESMFTFSGTNVTKLPHDHHELMAMVAPRAMLVIANGATDYVWLAEESGYVSERATEEIYKAMGISDRFGFSHSGHTHCGFPSNQQAQLEVFVDKFLLGKATNTSGISTNPFPNTDYNKWISAWKGLVLTSTANTSPTVSITSPVNNAAFTAPGSITINANAADADGTVSNVQFYNGTTLLGSDATSPYSFVWSNVAAGTYTLIAKVTDNASASTTSTAITVVVNTPANTAPTISLTSPANNASFTASGSITINANAADADGTVSNVQFYNGTTLLGSDATSPYSFVWSNVAAGTYTITAKATDNASASTTSTAITLVVNAPVNTAPTVSITSPANNATFTAPGSITINANAADADGTVSNVQFYNGTTLLGSDATSPYSFVWSNVAAGTYTITVKATDNASASTTSTAITVVVNAPANTAPTVSLTSPANNASFTAPGSITINANATDADGTISNVQFYNGTTLLGSDATSPYSFVWSNVAAGTYTITVKATDNASASTTSTAITVVVNAVQGGPDPNVHIYLCFGQSNMEGQGPIETQDKTVDSRFQVMGALTCTGTRSFTLGKWAPATAPLFRCDTKLSPADYFGRTMVENLPSNIQVRVVPVAIAGCDIALFDKVNYASYAATAPAYMQTIINAYGGNPYARLVEIAKLAQKDGVIKGILMHQGETNTGQTTWPGKVKGVYDNLIKDLGLDPTKTPLLVGEVVTTAQGGQCGAHNAIIATVPNVIPNSYVISASGLPAQSDNLHFTSASYRTLGQRYAQKMLTLLNPTSNASPTVSISSPANNATFTAPASITINANAADADGTISNVQFYNGTTLLGSDATAPYSFVWANVAAGTYTITAKATDNANATSTSTAVTVTVSTITVGQTPYNGTAANIPGTIQAEEYDLGGQGVAFNELTTGNSGNATFRGDAVDMETTTDAGGGYNIGWVTNGEWLEYTVNVANAGTYNMDLRIAVSGTGRTLNIPMDGTNISGTVTLPNTGGWQTWQTVRVSNVNLTAGQKVMRLTMTADYMNVNYITFSPVNVAPTASITSPSNNATSIAPASITINANATDADGTVSNVQFYNGTTLLGSDATAPYSFVWTNVAAETYTLTAKATDNTGATTTSTAVTITVVPNTAPTVSITSPTNNAAFTAPGSITINANAADADGAVSNVQFYNGTTLLGSDTTSPYSFIWSNVAAGTYSLTVKATDNAGAITTSTAVVVVVSNPTGQRPYSGTPANIPGTIQAEEYDLGGQGIAFNELTTGNSGNATSRGDAVDMETTTDVGGGYNIGWVTNGEWLEYTVNVTTAGTYNIDLRIAVSGTGKSLHVEMDGVNISGTVTLPNTGGWQTWQTVTVSNINLTAGQKVMRLAMTSDYLNVNYVAFSLVNSAPATLAATNTVNQSSVSVGPNPSTDAFNVTALEDIQSISVTNSQGTVVYTGGNLKTGESIAIGGQLPAGVYTMFIQYTSGRTETSRLLKQ